LFPVNANRSGSKPTALIGSFSRQERKDVPMKVKRFWWELQ
jgi:hypothetical protein